VQPLADLLPIALDPVRLMGFDDLLGRFVVQDVQGVRESELAQL
jgi:hypothetical protein